MKFRNVFFFTIIAEDLIVLLATHQYGWTLEGLQAATRYSGRFSLVIFSLIFLFHRNERIKLNYILSDQFYLLFGIAHGIHLIELLGYVYLSGTSLVPYRIAGGALAYAFIFMMPLIQFQFNANKLKDTTFNKLVLVYSYYVWLIFFMTYISRVQGTVPNAGGSYAEHVGLLAWVSTLLGLKVQPLLFKKKSKSIRSKYKQPPRA